MKCPTCAAPSSVAETRMSAEGYVLKRTRLCFNGHRFPTFEVDGALKATVYSFATRRERLAALRARATRWARNEKIKALAAAGEKHEVLALQFGLSPNMVSTIARSAAC